MGPKDPTQPHPREKRELEDLVADLDNPPKVPIPESEVTIPQSKRPETGSVDWEGATDERKPVIPPE